MRRSKQTWLVGLPGAARVVIAGAVLAAACGPELGASALRVPPPGGTTARAGGDDAGAPPRALPLVPRPRSGRPGPALTRRGGTLVIDRAARIGVDAEARAAGERLAGWLELGPAAIDVLRADAPDPPGGIVLRLDRSGDEALRARDPAVEPPRSVDEEAFVLDVSPTRATVRARHPSGLFYGAQALAQLAGARRIGGDGPAAQRDAWSIPCVHVDDAPRFAFRAMHLDVARHFFSREVVERYVDLLAFYRFNVFHWHLTDDQGFRLDVKGHPELVAAGGKDGFYTRDDVRAVVEYARARSITVVPEIEMPGHARAVLASHPELSCTGKKQEVPRTWGVFDDVFCAGNEKTYELLGDVLSDAASSFPSRLVHVGGDEVPTKRWAACAKCRAAMKAANVGVDGLQGVFMRRVSGMLERLGKRPLVWDDALESLAKAGSAGSNAAPVIVAWQSKERGRAAASAGLDVVMAPYQHAYLNFKQSRAKGGPGHDGFLPWSKVHAFDPMPDDLDATSAARVLGGEGALWTEYIETPEQLDAMALPRMAALAEALWSGRPADPSDFAARFASQLSMLDASGVRYFVEPPDGLPSRRVILPGQTVTLTATAPPLYPFGVVRWTNDGSEPTAASPALDRPLTVGESTSIAAALFLPSGRASPVVRASIVQERPRAAVAVEQAEPGVFYTYVEADLHRLPDFGALPAKARGRAGAISLAAVERALGKLRQERFGLLFEGFVRVRAPGVHRFVATADDGIRVEVDGEKLLEDDGEHEARESSAEIALEPGLHRLRVSYFQGAEGKELDLKIEGPDLPLGPLDLVVDARTKR